ncbi:MAG: DUF1127 domain-containing protein [Alphaproteobacteria bacterium]|jgi:uncharacterized protein YjiS (DUF1127 family)|nr:DUF1127 domain-containing protein [Alphaproteobacteria bacterium]|tara:strand:- start:34 stop:264 length:231 start_codon:yes stop_codon:yes gene_type:complete
MNFDRYNAHASGAGAIIGKGQSVGTTVAGIVQTLENWAERARQRRALAGLDDHMLKDIGLNRATMAAEAEKPFWRD